MVHISKRMKEALKAVDVEKMYTIEEAIHTLSKAPKVKFDESIELHLHLRVDPKASDQMVRGTVVLPHGSGKKVRIAVICKGELEQRAKDAGAEFVGYQDLMDKIQKGFMDFDVMIATPDSMKDLSKLGKVLGPRGLMPTPKAGTVTMDIEKAIKEVKAGKIEFKSDKQAGIHVGIGKRSFSNEQLVANTRHILETISHINIPALKGATLIKTAYISSTMGPGLRLSL